jgi:cobalt-precorrin 5A hydrolase
VQQLLSEQWSNYDGFICIMAAGIVVRSIAPLVTDKTTDPCVVVVDVAGRFAISLLSGHLGGGNHLAHQVAATLGAEPVITTGSDSLGLVALDIWAKELGLACSKEDMTIASALLVNNGELTLFSEIPLATLPPGLQQCNEESRADIIISNRSTSGGKKPLFHPKNLVLGVGCNRGTPPEEFSTALGELFSELGLSTDSINNLASIDKKQDEAGLLEFAAQLGLPLDFYPKEQINQVSGVEVSPAPLQWVGAIGVAEPCALLSASRKGEATLISRKRKWKNITMAVAEASFTLSAQVPEQ